MEPVGFKAEPVERGIGAANADPAAFALLALTALLIALGRPERTVAAPQRQGAVIMVTDTSGSMEAVDVRPTRLAAAQEASPPPHSHSSPLSSSPRRDCSRP